MIQGNGYETYLNLLYLGLKNGQLTKIDETVLGGVPAVHYSLLYETKSALLKGEVWIANQEGLPPVPLKADTEQMALDEAGAALLAGLPGLLSTHELLALGPTQAALIPHLQQTFIKAFSG